MLEDSLSKMSGGLFRETSLTKNKKLKGENMETEKRIQLVGTGGLRDIRKTGGTCKVEDKDIYTKSRYNDLPLVRRELVLILTHILVFHVRFCDGSTSISSVQNLAAVSGTMFEEQNLGPVSGYYIPTG